MVRGAKTAFTYQVRCHHNTHPLWCYGLARQRLHGNASQETQLASIPYRFSILHVSVSAFGIQQTGAGFSGFWYHLGLFQSMPTDTLYQYDYYCYSSACLSVILGFLQTPVEHAYNTCHAIQHEWYHQGTLSTYDMVDEFLRRLVPTNEEQLEPWLSRIHILSTHVERGVDIQQPTNRHELVQLIRQTTWIPFLTGQEWRFQVSSDTNRSSLSKDNSSSADATSGGGYLDGYFSVPWHPPCQYTAQVPFTWDLYLNSLNPAVGREKVFCFVHHGQAQINPFKPNNRWNITKR